MPLSCSLVPAISATALPPLHSLGEARQGQASRLQPKRTLVSQLPLLTCYDPFSTLHLKKKDYFDIT